MAYWYGGINHIKIYKLQKKAIRIINLGQYNAHTEPLFKKNRILKLMDIYKLQQQKFYYKFVNHKLPSYFQSFSLERGSRLNHYFTRNINDIPLPRVNHDFAKGTLRNCIPYTINHTPDNIKSKVFTHTHSRDSPDMLKTIILSNTAMIVKYLLVIFVIKDSDVK